MIYSSVTISLVPEAKGGPFIFWGELCGNIQQAAALGFDAVEIFAPGPEAIDRGRLEKTLAETKLKLAAFGTGAGWLLGGLTLTHPERSKRRAALEFISSMIELAAEFGAPVIVGSMQGRWAGTIGQEQALIWLRENLSELDHAAQRAGQVLLFEPLNRYETNLINSVADGLKLIEPLVNARLLADLFHMNIEEESVAGALRAGGSKIGHIHFVDSNRRPAGCGHIDFAEVARALGEIGYAGYLSAEALPYPDSIGAARQTALAFKKNFS